MSNSSFYNPASSLNLLQQGKKAVTKTQVRTLQRINAMKPKLRRGEVYKIVKSAQKSAEAKVSNRALNEGRPLAPEKIKTDEQAKKYVKVGLREQVNKQATQRSFGMAVFQKVLNNTIDEITKPKSPAKAHNMRPPKSNTERLNSALSNTRGQIKAMGQSLKKVSPVAIAEHVLFHPSKLGDGTIDGKKYKYDTSKLPKLKR